MENTAANLDKKLLPIIEELMSNGSYSLYNTNSVLKVYDVNSLMYIPLAEFILLAEEVTGVKFPADSENYIKNKIYVENISNFIPTVSHAVCTNFLEGHLFAQLSDFFLKNGGIKQKETEIKSLNSNFELEDVYLYKKILEDDNFLYKHMQSRMKKSYTQQKHDFFADPYEKLQNLHTKPLFTSNETESLRNAKLFCTTPKINDIFGLNQIASSIKQKSHPNQNKSFITQSNHYKPFSKPRGKQMEVVDGNDRPFTCKVPGCNRAFKRFEHLKRHNKMHTGEKPFKCKYPGCNRGFSRSDNLNAHYKTHNISPKQVEQLNFTNKNIDFEKMQ
ncbi:hypothetical protein NUSPORA_00660 [Nucleospora cyclopteri]